MLDFESLMHYTGHMTKKCGRCKNDLPLSAFRIKNAERGTYQSYCIECNKEKNREHYQQNKDRYKQKARAYELKNGGGVTIRHNLPVGKLEELLEKHDGMCWICKERPATVVDHDHSCCKTNQGSCGRCVRGVLCKQCNTGLGKLGDDINGLKKALDYLTAGVLEFEA
jgi:hypothetical protein